MTNQNATSIRYINQYGSKWQTWGTNHAEGFVYDCRDFSTRDEALDYALRAVTFYGEATIIDKQNPDAETIA